MATKQQAPATPAEAQNAPDDVATNPSEVFRGPAQVVDPTEIVTQKPARKTAAPAAEQPDDEIVETIDFEELQRLRTAEHETKKLNDQLAALNKKLADAEGKVKTYEGEKLSEQEKLQRDAKEAQDRVTQLQADLRTSRTEVVVRDVAAELNVKATLALKLVRGNVLYDDAGQPTNVRELLEAEIAENPQIVTRAATQSAPPANGDSGKRGKTVITLDDVRSGQLSDDQINQMWADGTMQKLMSGQSVTV